MATNKLGLLDAKKTLFLLCDVQEKFRFMNFFPELAKNLSKLLQSGKILEIPLICTEQNPEKLGSTIKELDVSHAVDQPHSKTKFSMVIPKVEEYLKSPKGKEVRSIVLMGLETHICVEQTAIDLTLMNRFDIHVVADCVLSRTLGDREFALRRLEKIGCIITSSENVIFKLMKDKNHEKFNEIRKLVADPSGFPGLTNKM